MVPFVPFTRDELGFVSLDEAIRARDRFACWASAELGLNCVVYGPERSLPDIRRAVRAGGPIEFFAQLRHQPDTPGPGHGPQGARVRNSGICSVGARQVLVAYNLDLGEGKLDLACNVARQIRSDSVRALGLDVGGRAQVSCNLIDLTKTRPDQLYDTVSHLAKVRSAELVGLVPRAVLTMIDPDRFEALGLGHDKSIEHRLGL